MIQKKQPVTKQFLLSFKVSHGDFYQKFISILNGKVHFCRQVKQHSSCPYYMLAQKCIFMSILQKKNRKFRDEEYQISQLAQILKKHRQSIQKSIGNQKNCILNKKKQIKLQQIENNIIQVVTRQNFAFNSFQLQENTYIYQLFKAILNRSQEVTFLGQQKYTPLSYSYLQIKQISGTFGQNIMFFDYNMNKNAPLDIKFTHQTTYILKVKERFAILYVKEPKQIKVISQGTITLHELESVFGIQQPKQQKNFLDKILSSKDTSINQTSKMFPDSISCSKCLEKLSQFDCLKWNYQFYCRNCLQNPRLDTSSIPSTLIQKYFIERDIKFTDYLINCAQCTGQTRLKKYNPSHKPQKYKCQVCQHIICLQHNSNIYQCFCQCGNCRQSTFNVVNINVAVCDKCKRKFCRTCKTLSDDFCGCICKLCFQLNQDSHTCVERCHFCYNHINKMKICVCGSKICYGCYYYKLKNHVKNGVMTCNVPKTLA